MILGDALVHCIVDFPSKWDSPVTVPTRETRDQASLSAIVNQHQPVCLYSLPFHSSSWLNQNANWPTMVELE